MTQFLDTPVDKSLGATGAWTDIDLSANIPVGASGAIFQILNSSADSVHTFGMRKNGSTDNRNRNLKADAVCFCVIGVDGDRKCEGQISNTDLDFFLVGYTETDAVLFTNTYDKSLGATGAWTDIDLSSELPAGAIAAIFEVEATSSATQCGLRKKGSTDDRTSSIENLAHVWFIVGVDGNRKCQGKISDTSIDFHLQGYLVLGVAETNGIDRSLGSTGSYEDITESSAPAGATGVFVDCTSTTWEDCGVRKNGTSYDYYRRVMKKLGLFVGLDSNKKWEGKIASTNVDFHTLGYFAAGIVEKNSSDVGVGVDAQAELLSSRVESDTGVGVDAQAELLSSRVESDTGVGVDVQSDLLAVLVGSEVGAGVDSLFEITVAKTDSDTGAGADAISEQLAALSQAETGAGAEAETLVKLINVLYGADTGAGADTISEQLAAVGDSEAPGYNGTDNLAGSGGVTITHNLGISNYQPEIELTEESGAVGEIWVTDVGVNAFKVRNSGIGKDTFSWTIHKEAVAADHRGTDNLAGPGGVTITHNLGISNYQPEIELTEESGAVGEIWITDIAANSFVVRNSGIGTASFSWVICAENVEADHRGTDNLAGSGGVTITHNLDLAFYQIQATVTEESGATGEIWITDITANSFVVRNSGIGTASFSWVIYAVSSGIDAISEQLAALSQAETGAGVEAETLVKPINVLYGADTGAGADAETRGEGLGVESSYTAELGGVALWVPELSKQNFTITYEENNIARFSFLLQNCDINRTAITDHLTDDFVIYRGATSVFTGSINSDSIEYLGIDKIRIPGYAKSIKLGYEFYKHMLTADAEAVGSVQVNNAIGPIGAVLWYSSPEAQYFDQTTAANNNTTFDVQAMLWSLNAAILMGADATFTHLTIKYSYAAFYDTPSVIVIEYSTAAGWSTLTCTDPTSNFTASPGTYTVLIPTPPGDWATKTVNGINKFWIRWRQTASIGEDCSETHLDQIWGVGDGSLEDKTTEANNVTVNDIEVNFNIADYGLYVGHNESFYSVKTQYSTKGLQSGTPVLKIEYSKGSGAWGTLDCIDTSQYFTADVGEHYLMIPNKPSDWAKDTVNSVSKFWIRIVSVSGSYTVNPKLDQLWISQTDVCRIQFDNLYLDDMLDDVLIDTDYSFQKALVNSTFETGVASWSGNMTQSSTQKHGGTYSAKLIASAANVTMDSEFLPAAGVKDIAFWTYLITLTTPPFRYSLMYYDRNQTYISSEIFMTLTSVETEWTEHEYTHDPSTFPAGTKYVKLSFDFWNAGSNPAGTVYIDDVVLESTVPHIIVPGMRGEYYSKLQWVAGLANAATWEDGDGCKQNYLWWVDSDDIIHVEQSTGITYNDITSSLSVLTNKRSYFDMANRLWGLGSGDGINQTRAATEDITAQTANGLREALVTDARILEYEALKEFTQKALTISKTETKVITLNMPTYDWFEGGYAISDTIKLHQPVWGIPDETTYRIIRCDIGKDRVKIDVGDPRQHLDTMQADLKAQIDVSDVYMAGATNIYAQSVQGNMERTAATVYPLILKIRIPDDAVKINKVLLDWNLSGFRTYSTVAADGGANIPTSSEDGADVISSDNKYLGNRTAADEYAGDIETIAEANVASSEGDSQYQNGYLAQTSNYGGFRRYYTGCEEPADYRDCVYGYLVGDFSAQVQVAKKAHAHTTDLPILLGEVIDPHDHTVNAYGNHDHVVNIADHHHTVTIPDHTHPLTSGIVQESLGSPTLELYVNSVLVNNNYTGDNTDINIAGYMNTGAWNEIKLQPKEGTVALLRAELNAFVKLFIRSR